MAQVYISVIIHAPIEKTWREIRDFNSLPRWHPLISASHIEDDLSSMMVGCVRNLQLSNGGDTIRETLLAYSEVDRYCVYKIVESPMAIENYQARLQLIEVTEGNSALAQWQAEFQVPDELEAETVALVANIFREGLLNLDKKLSTGT